MILGINAINIKSSGGIVHLVNLLSNIEKKITKNNINSIVIWSSRDAYYELKNIKELPLKLIKIEYSNFFLVILWRIFKLKQSIYNEKCDVVLSLDGIAIKNVKNVALLQNLLPLTPAEYIKYGLSIKVLKNFFLALLFKYSYKNSDAIIILNKFSRNLFNKKFGKTFSKVRVINHGVSNVFKYTKENISPSEVVMSYISSVDVYKNHISLFQALNQIKTQKKIILNIIGSTNDDDLYKFMQNFKFNKKIKIKFHNKKNQAFISNILKKTDIVLFLSGCEALGIPLIEAMALNKKILCSDKCGFKDFSNNQLHYCNPRSVNEIKSKLIGIINYNDKKKNYNISSKQFSWKLTSKKTFDLIVDIYNQKKKVKKNKIISNLNFRNFFKINLTIVNYLIPNFIWMFFYLIDKKKLMVDYIIVQTYMNFFIMLFSGNMRSFIAISDNTHDFNKIFTTRILISIFLAPIILLLEKIHNISMALSIQIYFLISVGWLIDILLIKYYNSKNTNRRVNINYIYLVCMFIIFILHYIYGSSNLIISIIFGSSLMLLFLLINLNIEYEIKFKINTFNFSNFSWIFLILSNFVLRLSINKEFDYLLAADIFLALSLMTFMGSLVTNSFGVLYIKENRPYPIYIKSSIIFILVLSIIAFFSLNFENLNIFKNYFNIKFIFFALISCVIFFISQTIRQIKLIDQKMRITVFKMDILYSFFSILLLFIFSYYFSNKIYLYVLILSLFNLIIYLKKDVRNI